MQDRRVYAPLDEALLAISRSLKPTQKRERVSVREAFGRLLATDIVAARDSPRGDVSHFDGYALVSEDTVAARSGSPRVLTLKPGASRLDRRPRGALRPGQSMKVATGGYLPLGADAVVPLEDVSERGGKIEVSRQVMKGERVYRAGSDVRKGDRVLRAGKAIMGQDQVLLASLHIEEVSVVTKPRVAILPTGTELTSTIGDTRTGRVVESHSLILERLVEGAGGAPTTLPIVPDDPAALSRTLREALRRYDIVLTLAGSSIGEPDLVDSTIRGFGKSTTLLIHGIRVNRGRVMGCAVIQGRPVIILPGLIQGALNAFIVLAYPIIRFGLGKGLEEPPAVPATMAEDWEATGSFKEFDQVVYLSLSRSSTAADGLSAFPGGAATEKVSFLVSKNAYTVVSGRNPSLSKDERIWAHLLPGFSALE